MTEDRNTTEDLLARLAKMEAMQMNHFRNGMFLLIYFTVAFACLAWEWNKHVKSVFEILPIATVVVICIWVGCVSKHARDLSRLRNRIAESTANAGLPEQCEAQKPASAEPVVGA